MKNIIFNKLALAMILVVFAFASAQVKLDVKVVGETRADALGGVKPNENQNDDGDNGSGGANFFQGGSFVDELHIGFTATVDNVVAHLKLRESGGDAATGIVFDGAYLEVKDLFDGLLSLKFFDIGYSKGKNNIIRPDIGSNGIKFTIKPIDLLSITLGYGIKTADLKFGGTANSTTSTTTLTTNGYANNYPVTNTTTTTTTPYTGLRLHAIQLDIGINNAFVPAGIHFGTLIVDGQNTGLNIPKGPGAEANNEKIYHMSIGATADLLAFLKAGALNLDLGVVLPFASTMVVDADKTDGDYDRQINFAAALHGSIADLGVEGLGLSYYIHYILDTTTKAASFDDLDYEGDDADGMIKFQIEPSYAIGQFKIDLKGEFIYVGKKEAQSREFGSLTGENLVTTASSKLDKAYSSFYVEPEVHWTPASGMSVSAYFRYYNNNMEIKNNGKMRLGLRYTLAFGIEGI